MDKAHKAIWIGIRFFVDMGLIILAWCLAYYLRFYTPIIAVSKGIPDFEMYFRLIIFIILIWGLTFRYFGLYTDKRFARVIYEFFVISEAHIVALVLFITFNYFFDEFRYSRVCLAYFAVLGVVFIPIGRSLIRKVRRLFKKRELYDRKVVVIGKSPYSEIVKQYVSSMEMNCRIIGEVDISEIRKVARHEEVNDSRKVIPLMQLNEFVRDNYVDEIIIALDLEEQNLVPQILKVIAEELVEIKILADFHNFIYLNTSVDIFNGLPIISINESPLNGWYRFIKRFMDIVLSFVGILFFFPLMILIATLIKITSKGSVLYLQQRMGLDGKKFDMLKFRTMKIDAEAGTGPIWANENDDRKTFFGSFLRKTSLDELPQLFNVLRGEMSLVGPRPERPVFVDQFRTKIPGYMLRHTVKAGVTGWAQINGWRGQTSLDQRIKCDLYYINHWSVLLDLKILMLTVFKGFINRNAY